MADQDDVTSKVNQDDVTNKVDQDDLTNKVHQDDLTNNVDQTDDKEENKEVDNTESLEQTQDQQPTKQENLNDTDDIQPTSATVVVIEDKSENTNIKNNDNLIKSSPTNTQTETVKKTSTQNIEILPELNLQSPEQNQIEVHNPDGFGKDFNWEMHEKNNKLIEENKRLFADNQVKEKHITKLEEALTTLHDELKFLESQEVQSVAKDLAKKNRRLAVQIERERNRTAKYEIESERLKVELLKYSHHHLSPKKVVEPMSFNMRASEMNVADNNNDNTDIDIPDKKEFDKLNKKLIEARNEINKYKNQNNKLKKALKKEIGDDTINVNEIINNDSHASVPGWKGRAEKIAILQSKLNDIRKEIELNNNNRITISNKNDQHKYNINLIASKRAKKYDLANNQIKQLNKLNDELKSIIRAKNSRIKGLETNSSSFRKKLNFFVEKSKSDDTLIETLQSRLNKQFSLQLSLQKKENDLNKNIFKNNNLLQTINLQNNQISILNCTIDEMKNKLNILTTEKINKFQILFEKFNNDDKIYQIKLLQNENNKQKDIILSYKKNLINLQKRLSRKSSPRNNESNIKFTKTLKMSQLKEKMETMTKEQQLIKASYLSIIENKEQEIKICKEMIKEQSLLYQNYTDDINKQIKELKSQIIKT